jgi:hypothetical protein
MSSMGVILGFIAGFPDDFWWWFLWIWTDFRVVCFFLGGFEVGGFSGWIFWGLNGIEMLEGIWMDFWDFQRLYLAKIWRPMGFVSLISRRSVGMHHDILWAIPGIQIHDGMKIPQISPWKRSKEMVGKLRIWLYYRRPRSVMRIDP